MVPYGLIADVHLHEWSSFSTATEDGQNTRLVGLLDEIKRCAQEVHAAGGSVVVIAGDMFHVRGSVAPSVLNALVDCLAECHSKFKVNFYILAGNHDIQHKDTTRLGSAVTALACKHVSTISHATSMSGMAMIPWVESVEGLKTQILAMTDGITDAGETDLIIHAPIDGVIKGLPMNGLDPAWLASVGFRRIFAGHYHNHKAFPGGVYSIGALAHHTWSDIGSQAGYLLVYPDRVDRRKSHLPEFIDLSQLTDLEPDELPFLVDGNYVRVKVEASKTKEVEEARQELLAMGAKAVIVQASPKAPARVGAERATTASGGSLEVSVADFIKGLKDVPVEDVMKEALTILTKVDEMGEAA